MLTVGAINWDAVMGLAATLALGVSGFSLYTSWKSGREAKRTRDGMIRVQEQMADALGRIAEAQEAPKQQARAGSGDTGVEGGTPSVRLVPRGGSGAEHLEITNRGPGPIKIVDFQVLGQPEIVVRGGGDPRGAELYPGEKSSVMVAITLGTQLPLDVLTKWRDPRGVHDRVQRVGWS
jgi:hypothetical protein